MKFPDSGKADYLSQGVVRCGLCGHTVAASGWCDGNASCDRSQYRSAYHAFVDALFARIVAELPPGADMHLAYRDAVVAWEVREENRVKDLKEVGA